MGIYDVPAARLIIEVAKELKNTIKEPQWTPYVKTGAHRERTPDSPDWFYTRSASVLYQTYKNGNSGTGRLRTYYGGRKNRGVKPEEKRKASGKVIRTCLQSLEKAGFLKNEKIGRSVSGKGEKLLYAKAKELEKGFKIETDKRVSDKAERIERAKTRQKETAAKALVKKEETPGKQHGKEHREKPAQSAEQKPAKEALQANEAKDEKGTKHEPGAIGPKQD